MVDIQFKIRIQIGIAVLFDPSNKRHLRYSLAVIDSPEFSKSPQRNKTRFYVPQVRRDPKIQRYLESYAYDTLNETCLVLIGIIHLGSTANKEKWVRKQFAADLQNAQLMWPGGIDEERQWIIDIALNNILSYSGSQSLRSDIDWKVHCETPGARKPDSEGAVYLRLVMLEEGEGNPCLGVINSAISAKPGIHTPA
ncbi:hypothetical protein BJ165DRAFT_1502265, partial [Panaeolus papilionaceus]